MRLFERKLKAGFIYRSQFSQVENTLIAHGGKQKGAWISTQAPWSLSSVPIYLHVMFGLCFAKSRHAWCCLACFAASATESCGAGAATVGATASS